ncbi:hypothetical protein SNE40_011795 [Patella caerulea]|uniref:Uncharacterized protein n=1 Tax=Patella caerulea TaxID=87958 RepID=A0AAN8JQ26_PATCE
MKAVGPVLLGRIRQFYIENYDQSVIQLPGAICGRCRNLLLKVERGEKALEDLPEPYDFSKILLTAITRTSPTCKCVLCEIARENTVSVGHRPSNPFPLGRPKGVKEPQLPSPRPVRVCQRCG